MEMEQMMACLLAEIETNQEKNGCQSSRNKGLAKGDDGLLRSDGGLSGDQGANLSGDRFLVKASRSP
jgi:hypothetical protein